ncbi:MAG: hypothetical protein E5X67_21325 [Mesorhizobium sp.]|uniref:E2/UBC family protein n=1 Tax=Mesorhizobium sp. TaxID=1871066 RepID=UPI0012091237|nr:E2/UBC family protein [Mesorhizobium sp.]TIP26207.1 MAG: hypothetical protein E5X67_21325 [Mesorhizobium sp.]
MHDAVRQIHDAVLQRGFSRDWSLAERLVYSGSLDRTSLNIPVDIEIDDLDFVGPPEIRISAAYELPDRKMPHVLGPRRSLCYYAKGAVVLDRYNPGGTILQCLDQAEKVVRDAVRGRSDADFADEFQVYWSTKYTLVDLPKGYFKSTSS